MLSQHKPHDLSPIPSSVMNDVVSGTIPRSTWRSCATIRGGKQPQPIRRRGGLVSRKTVLRQYVDSVKQDYDYVLLDCRPSLGMLVINVLSASNHFLAPIQVDYLAAEVMELFDTVQSVKCRLNLRNH